MMMRAIVICEENREALLEAIKAGEGKARTRRLSLEDIEKCIADVEKRLSSELGVPKRYWRYLEVRFGCGYGHFPNAYKGNPEATVVRLKYRGSQWYLADVNRSRADKYKSMIGIERHFGDADDDEFDFNCYIMRSVLNI